MSAFRGHRAGSNQSVSAATVVELSFGTEDFDLDAAYAANRLTVPAGWNGKYAEFFGGAYTTTTENDNLFIQVSTDSGSNWTTVAASYCDGSFGLSVSTGPLLMNTGDIYRLAMYSATQAFVKTGDGSFFSGRLVDQSNVAVFRATNSGTQAISATTLTEVNFGTETFDTASAFASNRFTVPVGLNGKYGCFSTSLRCDAVEDIISAIQVSTDSGSNWTVLVESDCNGCEAIAASTGPLLMNTGDIYRVVIFTNTASTITNTSDVFFAGHVFTAA